MTEEIRQEEPWETIFKALEFGENSTLSLVYWAVLGWICLEAETEIGIWAYLLS